MKIFTHLYDIPDNFAPCNSVAVDTETMGLKPHRDRLCLLQISNGDENCHIVQFNRNFRESPNLQKIMQDPSVQKIFHYARFDIMMIARSLQIDIKNVYCTKIASKLVRTFTNRHSLLDLCKDILNIEISKEQTQTDWGTDILSEEQKIYAATDVLYLHKLRDKLNILLQRENRMDLAISCFDFLVTRTKLDIMCGEDYDIFQH